MAFELNMNMGERDAGKMKGTQMDIACECWFNSRGKIRPILLKYRDEEEAEHTVSEIFVHTSEEKNYAGIPSIEFDVTLVSDGIQSRVRLIYFKKECRWVINLRS